MHARRQGRGLKGATPLTALAGLPRSVGPPAEHAGRNGAVELGDRDHDRRLNRVETGRVLRPPFQGLELQRLGGDVGNVELRQHRFSGAGVVIGRAADQGEPGEGHHRIDRRAPVLHEVALHGRTPVQSAGEGRDDPQALPLQRGDHAVIVTRVIGQNVGAQHQHAHRSDRLGSQRRQACDLLHNRGRRARVVEADLRIILRRRRVDPAAQAAPRTVGIAPDQEPHHSGQVLLRARQPILHRQEVGPQILRGAGDEFQDLRQSAQHGHLPRAGAARPARRLALGPAQALQKPHHAGVGAVHLQAAQLGQADDLPRRDQAQHRVAGVAAGEQRGQNGADLVVDEQHGDDDDVAPPNVVDAVGQGVRVISPVGRGVHAELQPRQILDKIRRHPVEQAGQVPVQGDEHHPHRRSARVSGAIGRSGCAHRISSRLRS